MIVDGIIISDKEMKIRRNNIKQELLKLGYSEKFTGKVYLRMLAHDRNRAMRAILTLMMQ